MIEEAAVAWLCEPLRALWRPHGLAGTSRDLLSVCEVNENHDFKPPAGTRLPSLDEMHGVFCYEKMIWKLDVDAKMTLKGVSPSTSDGSGGANSVLPHTWPPRPRRRCPLIALGFNFSSRRIA